MANNEFLHDRIITAHFSIPDSAVTQVVDPTVPVYIPGGAIINGITMMNTAAPTVAGVSATLDLRAGSEALIKTVNMSAAITAQTIPYAATISGTTPLYVADGGLLRLSVAASGAGGSNWTLSPDVYVRYVI